MSDIVLSAGVRSNLLQLQNTADLIGQTQTRLATGKKVNSALDNPTNFFTASSLNARASDLSNILDTLSNAIKTVEAADNALTAITNTVETLQSTARQARQDNSFNSTSFSISDTATGNLSISGGGLAAAEDIAVATGSPTATTLNGTGANFGTDFTGGTVTVNGTNVTVRGDSGPTATTLTGSGANFSTDLTAGGTITINSTNVTIRGDQTASASSVTGSGGSDLTGDPDLSALNGESITITSGSNTATYNFTNSVGGQGAALDTALNSAGFTVTRTNAGLNISRSDGADFNVQSSNAGVQTAVGIAGSTGAGLDVTNGTEAFDATITTVLADIDAAGITGLTASDSSGQVGLSLASGADITIAGGDTLLTEIGFAGGNRSSTNGTEAFDATVTTVIADFDAAGITGLTVSDSGGQVGLSLASGDDLTLAGADSVLTAIGFGTGNRTSTNGSPAALQTVDQLVTAITNNANLAAAGVRASNDDGKLEITFESTSATDLTLTGVTGTGDDRSIDGGSGTTTIEGNETRRNLETQYNELRDQLNSLADDAFFNGINLLDGDQLEVTFNEQNTSSITIQSTDTDGVNTTTLGLTSVTAGDFASNSSLDTRLASLQDALGELRSQASAFGSNLSVVQNREEFTKATINTLQSGADNLTLADLNEEGANLLALQTRQQLSTTALSLAAQADQNVLRLF